jgi:hypothetical protein
MGTVSTFPGVKRPGREADHSPMPFLPLILRFVMNARLNTKAVYVHKLCHLKGTNAFKEMKGK